jgi:hypothetical protein
MKKILISIFTVFWFFSVNVFAASYQIEWIVLEWLPEYPISWLEIGVCNSTVDSTVNWFTVKSSEVSKMRQTIDFYDNWSCSPWWWSNWVNVKETDIDEILTWMSCIKSKPEFTFTNVIPYWWNATKTHIPNEYKNMLILNNVICLVLPKDELPEYPVEWLVITWLPETWIDIWIEVPLPSCELNKDVWECDFQ